VVVPVVVTGARIAAAVVAEVGRLLAASDASEVVAEVGWIAWDPAGVERMQAGRVSGRDVRTPLLRSAAVVNDQLALAQGVNTWVRAGRAARTQLAAGIEEA
jgi:hypothetical protein